MLFILLLFAVPPAIAHTSKFQAAHASNTTLYCDYPHFKMTVTPWQIYWILPNETVIQPRFSGDMKYHIGHPPAYDLTIMNIDHLDFGWFYCVILWDNYHYLVDSVKVGLNIDGALYGELTEQYRQSALTGGLVAAVVFIVLVLGCLVWHIRYREKTPKVVVEPDVYELDEPITKFEAIIEKTETDSGIEKNDAAINEEAEVQEVMFIRNMLGNMDDMAEKEAIFLENKLDNLHSDTDDVDKIALEIMHQPSLVLETTYAADEHSDMTLF